MKKKAETPVLWPPHAKSWLIGKDSDAGRDGGQEEKGTTEDEMAGWHHRLNGRESEWTPGVGDGQGGLVCCDSWGCKESDMTEWLNWTEVKFWHSIEIPEKARKFYLFKIREISQTLRHNKGGGRLLWENQHTIILGSWMNGESVVMHVLSNLLPVTEVSKTLLQYDGVFIKVYFLLFSMFEFVITKRFVSFKFPPCLLKYNSCRVKWQVLSALFRVSAVTSVCVTHTPSH